MATKDIKLPVVFTEITWDDYKAEKYGKINTQNLVIKAMSILTGIIKEHGGKIVHAQENQLFCTFPNTKKAIQAACNKQRAISDETLLANIETSLKIGLHYGQVKLSKDEVSGDAVSIARKIKSVAEADQILLTRDTVQEVPTVLNIEMMKKGKLKFKDSLQRIEVFEALWQEDSGVHTAILEDDVRNQPSLDSVLVVKYQGKKYKLGKMRSSFLMGRSKENDIIIDENVVSRNHCSIKFDNGRFRLADQSTNGTNLQTEDKEDIFLHQDDMQLEGKGVFCLGQKIEKEYPHLFYYSVIRK